MVGGRAAEAGTCLTVLSLRATLSPLERVFPSRAGVSWSVEYVEKDNKINPFGEANEGIKGEV